MGSVIDVIRRYLVCTILIAIIAILSSEQRALALVGFKCAYASDRGSSGTYHIWLSSGYDNSHAELGPQLTSSSGCSDTGPSWRPQFHSVKGGRIAFERTTASTGASDIYVVDLNASYGVVATYCITSGFSGNKHHPAWSPDGNSIAFVLDDTGDSGSQIETIQIYNAFAVDMNNNPVTLSVSSSPAAITSSGTNIQPYWSIAGPPVSTGLSYPSQTYPVGALLFVKKDPTSGNGDVLSYNPGSATIGSLTSTYDPTNAFDDIQPNQTSAANEDDTPPARIPFVTNWTGSGTSTGSYGIWTLDPDDGAVTSLLDDIDPSGISNWNQYPAVHYAGSSEIIDGTQYYWMLMYFVSNRVDASMSTTTNLYQWYEYYQWYDENEEDIYAPVKQLTADAAGVSDKDLAFVYLFVDAMGPE